MTNEPSLHEVLRRLDETAKQLQELAQELRADRAAAANTYLRQDVYTANSRARDGEIRELRNDLADEIKARQGEQQNRRTLTVGSILAVLSAVLSPIITAIVFTTQS